MDEKIKEIADRIHSIYEGNQSNFIKLTSDEEQHLLTLLEILVINGQIKQLEKQ